MLKKKSSLGILLGLGLIQVFAGLAMATIEESSFLGQLDKSYYMDGGWACKNAYDKDPNLYIRVWYEYLGTSQGHYRIQIQRAEGQKVYNIAYVNPAILKLDSDQFVYAGMSSQHDIELQIDISTEKLLDLPGTLRVVGPSGPDGSVLDTINVVCNRTRFSPGIE